MTPRKQSSPIFYRVLRRVGIEAQPIKRTFHYGPGHPTELQMWFTRMARACRVSAKRRNLEYELTVTDIYDQYNKQDGLCAYTGRELVTAPGHPFTASIDRVDSKLGYSPSNIALVGWWVNVMKNEYPLNEYVELCRLVTEQAGEHSSFLQRLLEKGRAS